MVWGMIQRHRIQRVAGEITGYLGYLSQRRRDGSLNGSLPYYHYRPLYRYWLEWQPLVVMVPVVTKGTIRWI